MVTFKDTALTTMVDSFFKSMKETISKGEEVEPNIWFFGREHGQPVLMPVVGISIFFQSKEAKRHLPPFIKQLWTRIAADKKFCNLVAVVMLSDAWTETHQLEEGLELIRSGRYVPLTDKPGMSEALLVQVSMADGERSTYWPYVRGGAVGKEVVFAREPIVLDTLRDSEKGMLQDLWPL